MTSGSTPADAGTLRASGRRCCHLGMRIEVGPTSSARGATSASATSRRRWRASTTATTSRSSTAPSSSTRRAPEVPVETTVESLAKKFGTDVAGARELMTRADGVAASVGLEFHHARRPARPHCHAHRLLHLAADEGGSSRQGELKEALLAAYFLRGENVGDHDVLRAVAVGAGLDPARVDEVLASEEYLDAVHDDIASGPRLRRHRRAVLRGRREVRPSRAPSRPRCSASCWSGPGPRATRAWSWSAARMRMPAVRTAARSELSE